MIKSLKDRPRGQTPIGQPIEIDLSGPDGKRLLSPRSR